MPQATIDGTAVHYDEYGDTAGTLLMLLHGLNGDASTMATLAARLAGSFHVVVPDAIGHGRSARPSAFTLADQGAMVAGLVRSLGEGPAVLVGVSMGSYIVARAAIDHPDVTSALVLVVTRPNGAGSSSAAFAASRGVDLATLDAAAAMELLSLALWSPDTPAERRAELLAEMNGTVTALSPAEQGVIERSLAGFDNRAGLAELAVPTLVVSGESDGLNPPAAGREVADLVPGARFEVYEHSGHMLAYEEGDRLAAEILSFAATAPVEHREA